MSPSEDNIFICDTNMNFVRKELHDFLSYWEARRGTRQFPSRADIKPGDITDFLPWTHMHDVARDGKEFRIRLIGTALADTFGNGDMRGKPISVLPPRVFERVQQGIEAVLKQRAPVRTYAPHAALPGKYFEGIESCFAPLSENGTDINIIIAASILESRR